MRKCLLAGLIALYPLFVSGEDVITIDDLSGGIVNNIDSTIIENNSVSDALNVLFDDEYPVGKRSGMTRLNSTILGDGEPVSSQF